MGDTISKKKAAKKGKPPDHFSTLRKNAEKRLKSETARLRELSSADLKKLVHELVTHQIELEMQNEELRSAREELESSRARYADLYDFAPVGYFSFDRSGLINDVNLAGADMIGRERRHLLKKPIAAFIEPADRTIFRDHLRAVFMTQAVASCEVALVKKDGTKFSTQWNSLFITGKDGDPELCRTAVSDVTERKRVEVALKESEKKYRTLFENMLDGYAFCKMLFDKRGRPVDFVYLVVNSAFGRLTGLENVVGRKATDVIPGIRESHPELLERYGRVAATGRPEKFEIEFKPLDLWLSISVYSTEREYFTAVFDNISERKRTEDVQRRAKDELETQVQERTRELQMAVFTLQEQVQELAQAENDLRISSDTLNSTLEGARVVNALLQLLTQRSTRKEYLVTAVALIRAWSGCRYGGIRITDDAGRIPYAASEGFSDEFLQSESMLMLGADHCACTRVIGGTPEPQDLPVLTQNGSFYSNNTVRFVQGLTEEQQSRYRGVCVRAGFTSVAVIPVKYREKVLGAIHLADERENMVPLKIVEEAEKIALIIGEALYRFCVEEERARLVSAVESAAEAIVITDPSTGVIVYANPAFGQMTGYGDDEIMGRTLHFLESGKLGETFYAELRETLAQHGVWNGRLINRRKSGALYYEDCTVSPVKDSQGQIANYVYIKRDVTDKLRLESIAESVNMMDNIGYVFSGVRHEIGNPINSINMILGLLRAKQDVLTPEAIKEYLAKMTEQVARVEYILRSLKSFNLYETQEPQDLDLSLFMESFLPLIRDDLGKKGIAIETRVEPGMTAFADSRALQQVLLNIVTNAADAVNERENPVIALSLSRNAGSVQIRIQDNGQGIPEDKMKDVLKPFYTTKKHGTGLGLVIVQKMIARMNGRLDLASTVGKGTIVDITLQEAKRENA